MGNRPLLAERFESTGNALNLVRLALASTVVLAHSWDLTYGSADGRVLPWAGAVAVDSFFAISGFLIAQSRRRLSLGRFLLRRAARILPAFWVCLIVTAFLMAPLAAAVSGTSIEWAEASGYVWRNATLTIHQVGIGQVLAGVPFPNVWNPSLWTLGYEFLCYLIAAALFAGRGDRGLVLAGVLAASTGLIIVSGGLMANLPLLRLGSFFAAGALLQVLGDRVPRSGVLAAIAVSVVVVTFCAGTGTYHAVAPIPLAYVMLWLGAALPTTIASRTDLSYGVYVFAGPLQQLAVLAGVAAAVGPVAFAGISLLMVLPVAWASWLVVERPALEASRARSHAVDLFPQTGIGVDSDPPHMGCDGDRRPDVSLGRGP